MRRRFGKDWERIWKYKTKYPGEKEGDSDLPKECLKGFV
jgi:hypothetical protein